MADFDDTIRHLRDLHQQTQGHLDDLRAGTKWFRNDEDVSAAEITRAQSDLQKFEILIAAYEAHNADRT